MLSKLVTASALMAFCVIVHALGLSVALRWLGRRRSPLLFRHWSWLFIRLAALIVFLHVVEIAAWALFLTWKEAMPDVATAVYFSAATYTTTGYGDVVLQGQWRWIAGIESLTGILMCGWSTGFFFAVVSRLYNVNTATDGTGTP